MITEETDMKTVPIHWIVVACLSLLAIGCAKTPAPDFYLLAPDVPSQPPGFEEGVAVGVGPVELPPHLDRNQIVSREASTKLQLSEQHQWAEPLKAGFTRVLIVALGLELDSNRIYALPTRRRQALDYQVAVDVFRFDGRLGGDVQLNARWAVLSGDGDTVLISKVSQIRVAIEGSDHGAFVAAQSLAVMRLGREIAGAVAAQMR
jgi:hypothetical protein